MARIVTREKAARRTARSIQALNRLVVIIEHAAVVVHDQARHGRQDGRLVLNRVILLAFDLGGFRHGTVEHLIFLVVDKRIELRNFSLQRICRHVHPFSQLVKA